MLYHYTDFTAFDGIIRCGELRLNNILNMNDASEMTLFINGICKAVIEKHPTNSVKRRISSLSRWKWNSVTPLMQRVFRDTEMTPHNGNGTVI